VGKLLFTKKCFSDIIAGNMIGRPGGEHGSRRLATVTDIAPYLPDGGARLNLDSDASTTAQEVRSANSRETVVYEASEDLSRIKTIAGELDPLTAITDCVRIVRELLEETAQGCTPGVDFERLMTGLASGRRNPK
jgi:hypothetical protein